MLNVGNRIKSNNLGLSPHTTPSSSQISKAKEAKELKLLHFHLQENQVSPLPSTLHRSPLKMDHRDVRANRLSVKT